MTIYYIADLVGAACKRDRLILGYPFARGVDTHIFYYFLSKFPPITNAICMLNVCSYLGCISVPSHSPGLGRTNMVPPSPVVHHASCRVWAMWTVRWPVGKVGTCADQCQLKIGGWFGLRTKNRTKTRSQIEIHYSHSPVTN